MVFILDRDLDTISKVVKTRTAVGYKGQPEDVANVVSFLLSEKSGYITGQTVSFVQTPFTKIQNCPSPPDISRRRVAYELKQKHINPIARLHMANIMK